MRKYNLNEIDDTSNFQDTAKAGCIGKFIALKAYIEKGGNSQIVNLNFHLKKPPK